MEKKDVDTQNLIKIIENFELQNGLMKQKLQDLNNSIKKEERKKIWYEVNIEELKKNSNFYETQFYKASKKYITLKKICSQFEVATECYKRLIEFLEANFKPQNKIVLNNLEVPVAENREHILQKLECAKMKIQQNSNKIDSLLSDILGK